jgi:hypothetical protein
LSRLLAIAIALLALAAIALLVVRPARVIEANAASLASSIGDETDARTARCEEVQSGRANGSAWRCEVVEPAGSGQATRTYAIHVDEWGCWDASVSAPANRTRPSACIWLLDYVEFLD